MDLLKPVISISILTILLLSIISPHHNLIFFGGERELYNVHDIGQKMNKNTFKIIKGIEKEGETIVKSDSLFSSRDTVPRSPDIGTCGKNLIMVYEITTKDHTTDIAVQFSGNYGKSWSNIIVPKGPAVFGYPFEKTNQTKPSVSVDKDGHAICVFESDDNRSRLYMLEFPNIANPWRYRLSWLNLYTITNNILTYRIKNLHDLSVDISSDSRVIIAGVCDILNVSSNSELHDVPIILYSEDGNTFMALFDEYIPYRGLRNTTVSFDKGAFITYQMDDSGILCLYFPDGKPDDGWRDLEIENTDYTSYRNPSVCTWGDNVTIVFESFSYNNSDIVYLYSNDLGNSWLPGNVEVASTSMNERYPCVAFQRNRLIISFEKKHSLYITATVDLETWSDPEKISRDDKIVYPYFGFSRFGEEYGIVWDCIERGKQVIRFYDDGETIRNYNCADLKILDNFTFKNGRNGILEGIKSILSIEIENAGAGDADSFMVGVYLKCRNKSRLIPLAVSSIDGLRKGERIAAKLSLIRPNLKDLIEKLILFANADSIVIKVDPDNSIIEENESNNEMSIKVVYETLFPNFVWIKELVSKMTGSEDLKTKDLEKLVSNMID